MKVNSDKLWSEQKSVLREKLDEETFDIYLDILDKVTHHADDHLQKIYSGDDQPEEWSVAGAIREGFAEVVEENGYLIPEVLSSILIVIIMHWTHGEKLAEGLSAIEFSLVAEALAENLEEKSLEAAQIP